MSLGVHNNLAMMNASRQFKINTGNKAKSAEKLSSGYRLNRSADDAAGLQISEKMRWQIRGLNRGTDNAQEGVSWVQTGDGALNEVHALLHRMRELTIQALNDTNTPADRAACQAEFDALQSEIDRITKTTEFNTKKIFDEHESPYYQCEGNVNWLQSQPHVISGGKNDLVIGYRSAEGDAPKTATITVPAGIYTTQELMDEIDDAIIAQGLDKEGIVLEYTHDGTCNLNLEGGEIIDTISGGLSYLFYEIYEGGSFGALIGTTVFENEFVELEISNQNNHLEFDIEDFNGNVISVSIDVPLGDYTRSELIDYLNSKLGNTDVTATAYGTGIKLEGANSIVTGFKGNMFKIDDRGAVYHSVFYDNVKYGNIAMSAAYFEGGLVKPTGTDQEEHQEYVITSTNNQLSFKANGADAPVTMQIPEGSYTVGEMVTKLNEFFTQEGLELTASVIPAGTSDYKGIRIDSTVKGTTSQVGVDRASSAFDTLFIVKEYNYYGSTADVTYERTPDKLATTTGAKELSGSNVPTITAGVSDQFKMVVDGTAYTITLDSSKTYTSAADIAAEINAQLTNANAPVGYKDKVEATVTGNNQILLTAKTGSGIKNLSVTNEGTNTGYNDIFVKTETTYSYTAKRADGTSSSKPQLTLGESIPEKMTFDNTNNKLNINFNGQNIQVDFPTGQEMTRDQILDKINEKLPDEVSSESDITFTSINATGTTTPQPVSFAQNGVTSVDTKNYSGQGSSQLEEGRPGVYKNNKAATITIGKVLPSSIEVTDDCNQLTVNINGVSKTLTLANKTYTSAELVKAIQQQINASYDQGEGADVSLNSSGQMVFTVHLKDEHGNEKNGANTTISCSTASSLLEKLHTTETAAVATSGRDLLSNITITDDTREFTFTYKSNGVTKTANLTLDKGTYSRQSFVEQLNKQLTAGNHDVKASLSGSKLRLTTTDVGNDTSISYHSDNGGNSAESVFGSLISETAATGTARAKVQDTVSITADTNIFEITVDGQKKTVILEEGDYNPTQFKEMLNRVFEDQNVGLTASLNSSGQLVYTTDEKGNDASIQMSYAGGGSSMSAIYGKQQTITPGLNASLDGNNKLVLTGTQNGGYISVTPEQNSIFLKPTASTQTYGPSKTAGYSSTTPAAIDGVNITEPIKIDEYNNQLNFSYVENGTSKSVSITVPDGEYYFAANGTNPSIVDFLQQQLDTQVGADKLKVTASTSGIRIETVNVGSNYRLNNFTGDFYKKVLCKCEDRTSRLGTAIGNGTQTNDLAYTVGRKDIKNNTTVIKNAINDTLTFDLTYGNNPPVELPLKIKLDPGTYGGEALVKEIQEKLDEQLVAAGLEAGTIIAGIGGVNTGVSGSNDNNALTLKLSPTVRLPAEGQYIIDGVSGNAAFSIFYQSEGEMVPAYVKGAKDISEGVTINPGETDLSFKVDGTEYVVTLDEKEYTAQELIDAINAQLNANGAPVVAEMDENVLKLSYTKLGKHSITDVNGLAKDELFFNENGDKDPHEDVMIQLSSNEDDALKIERAIINTAFLKINSVAITQPKYANKALVRLDDAIARVSEVRSTFGSEQNRLEHAIANNENTYENVQAAESRVRDTDMPDEMVENSRASILAEVSMSMQAQARMMTEGILKLLQ